MGWAPKLAGVALSLVAIMATPGQAKSPPPRLELKGTSTVRVRLPHVVGVSRTPPGVIGEVRYSRLEQPRDREKAEQLYQELRTAPPANPEGADSPDVRARVGHITLHLSDGTSLILRPALGCHTVGSLTACRKPAGKQVIYTPFGWRVVASPVLDKVLSETDWPQQSPAPPTENLQADLQHLLFQWATHRYGPKVKVSFRYVSTLPDGRAQVHADITAPGRECIFNLTFRWQGGWQLENVDDHSASSQKC